MRGAAARRGSAGRRRGSSARRNARKAKLPKIRKQFSEAKTDAQKDALRDKAFRVSPLATLGDEE